jgi:hypothetical protein
MKNIEALRKLWAWQWWYRPVAATGKEYGLSFLQKGFAQAQKSLHSPSRNTILRLIRKGRCVNCNGVVAPTSTGDHLIPTSKGGSQSIENYASLCARCNSSKGPKDLLDWWINGQEKTIDKLDLDQLCVYLRFTYKHLEATGQLDAQAPNYHEKAVQQAMETVPAALRGVTWPANHDMSQFCSVLGGRSKDSGRVHFLPGLCTGSSGAFRRLPTRNTHRAALRVDKSACACTRSGNGDRKES